MRAKSFLDSSHKLDGIIHILLACRTPVKYTQLARESEIKHKQSLFRYINYCMDKNFISKKPIGWKKNRRVTKELLEKYPTRYTNLYEITPRGKLFLDLVNND